MAAAVVTQHPVGRNPDYGTGERNTASIRVTETSTIVLAAKGTGYIDSVNVGVTGTLAIFYDTPSGGTADDTTKILEVDTSAIRDIHSLGAAFSRGLTVVITGSSTEMTVTGVWSRGNTRTVLKAIPRATL